MKKISAFIITVSLLFVFSSPRTASAQSLEETLSNLSSSAGAAYVSPIISAFGSNLNSGWVSKLPDPVKVGFTLDIKVVVMGSFFSDDNKSFTSNGEFYFTSNQADQILSNSGISAASIGTQNYNDLRDKISATRFNVGFSGPTIVGSESQPLNVNFPGGTIQSGSTSYNLDSYQLSIPEVKGLLKDLPIFPSAAFQVTGGTVLGTNLSVRFLPSIDIQDLGKFNFWGIGAINNINALFPNPLPLDIGVGYFYQKLTVGDVFETKASEFGLFAGKTFGAIVSFAPYAGLTFESSKTTVKYDYQSNEMINGVPVPPVKVNFELEGENGTGFLLGFNLKLSAFNINADYKIAKYKTISGGISLGF